MMLILIPEKKYAITSLQQPQNNNCHFTICSVSNCCFHKKKTMESASSHRQTVCTDKHLGEDFFHKESAVKNREV